MDLRGLAPLDVHEQARGLKMRVAGEIDVVDLRAFEGVGVLHTHVWGQEQEPVIGMRTWQVRLLEQSLLDDDSNVLMTQVPLRLDEVAHLRVRVRPDDHPVEADGGLAGGTDSAFGIQRWSTGRYRSSSDSRGLRTMFMTHHVHLIMNTQIK